MIPQTVLNFKLEKTKEKITSHSGLVLISECMRSTGMHKTLKEELPKPGSNRGYKGEEYVEPILLMLCGGGRELEDIRQISEDEALKKAIGLRKVPSPDAIGDWLRRIGVRGLYTLGKANQTIIEFVLLKEKGEEFTLDVDATGIEAEKREAHRTYKGYKGYMPMLGFLAETDICLVDEFREGNESPGSKALPFFRECLRAMPNGKRIKRVRSDSAWYQSDIFNECEDEEIIYSITADQDQAVKEVIKSIPADSWKRLKDRYGNDTDREYAETIHCMRDTKKAFRLIVQRWQNKQISLFEADKYFYYAIATNSEEVAIQAIYFHNQRGNAENYNKELKIGIGMEYMPCGQFMANAVYFRLGVIAYNLVIALKRLMLGGGWIRKTVATLRWQLFQIAGKLVNHSGKLILKLSGITETTLEFLRVVRSKCFLLQFDTG